MPEWRHVTGYEGIYLVSDEGQVRRACPRGGSQSSGLLTPSGVYPTIVLHRLGIKSRRQIHVLLMEAFVGPRPQGYLINHKDGDKWNCTLTNLEYVTPKQNQEHARDILGLYRSEDSGTAKLTRDQVIEMAGKFSTGAKVADLARQYGVSYHTVWDIFRRKKTWRDTLVTFYGGL